MTLKAIDSFIATVAPDKATVASFPEFIAIFGGAVPSKKNSKSKPKSYRDAFVRWWAINRSAELELLSLPENYKDWSDFDTYSDLLLFEKDLGYLTSAVLIFLEAPGAIAELGAFSQIPSLSERLVIVVKDEHHPISSFISLGPIRSVEKTQGHENSVCVIPSVKPEELHKHMSVISMTLNQKRARTKPRRVFDPLDSQHEILLTLDLINIFLVIQLTELQRILGFFAIDITRNRLDQILFLLQKTGLIACRHYGDNKYYIPKKFRKTYVDYTSAAPRMAFKRDRFKVIVWNEIQKDEFRKNVWDLENSGGKS